MFGLVFVLVFECCPSLRRCSSVVGVLCSGLCGCLCFVVCVCVLVVGVCVLFLFVLVFCVCRLCFRL